MSNISQNDEKTTFLMNFLTAGFATSMSYTLFAPIERIKIILQTHRLSNISRSEIYTKPLEVFNKVRTNQGFLSFWNGNGTYILKEFLSIGIRYITAKGLFRLTYTNDINETKNSILFKKYLAIFLSGYVSLTLTYPIEIVRIRLTKDMSFKRDIKVFKGFNDCVKKIFVKEGMKSFYKGYFFSSAFIIPYLTISFGIYENLKNSMFLDNNFGMLIISICLSQLFLYPLDTVRFKLRELTNIIFLKAPPLELFYIIILIFLILKREVVIKI